ncbi:MAG TPA: LuxR C-terminal-related transcriptional regulator [Bacteroidia bacterium]|nr:LuxR C-terminal-related transcriptional regulator [Bacteroidia bacterium]
MRYLYMSEYVKVLFGYTAKEMIELGPASQLSRVHPDDLLVFKSTLFNEFINYSKSIPAEDLKDTVFALNIRSQRKDGTYVNFLQQYVVLERDRSNNPLLTLGVATDITAFGKSNGVTFSVSKYTENARAIKVYSPNELDANHHITKREIEVIKYMLQGFTSKEIAVKLHISQYTVKAHRQNIMEKTHCKNAAQLSNYALTNGLI